MDDIERLIEFSEYGNRYSNNILQTILVLTKENTKKNKKLFIIGTCKNKTVIDLLEISDNFDVNIEIPNMTHKNIMIIQDYYKKKYDISDMEDITCHMSIKKLLNRIKLFLKN